ncbi:predicted protein [Uncinocarpus reesii 1704]|uniref:Acyl-CoA thioesterase II n=1 Tax=Uncinocarpus reesii (strain UAMH 1704) TaxID=336963 RepID=C4JQJ3_UNCRE|nr:uncharacterized protein UREG_03338 [Uncinocarpus reesii 1704]EEP78492.1 predicted protein [Uncinocarpus reesii 1704]
MAPAAESSYPTAPHAPAYLPLIKLFALDRLESGTESPSGHKYERFRARYAPLCPSDFRVAYGGYVFGHAAYAASKTVDRGMVIHNITGSFTLPGLRWRVSRKEEHPWAPSVDSPQWTDEVERGVRSEVRFSGTDIRKVKMQRYNASVGAQDDPTKYRQLHFYRLFGLPGDDSDSDDSSPRDLATLRARDEAGEFDNLHVCAHLFASDRNSLYLIAWALRRAHRIKRIASLSHTVIMHTHGPAMRMIDWDRFDREAGADGTADLGEGKGRKWFTIEAGTTRSGENRVLHQGQIWGADGTLVATTIQDGLLRVFDDGKGVKL